MSYGGYEESSGNVYEDLGLENSAELFENSKVGFRLYTMLKSRSATQQEIAELLGCNLNEADHLMNGHYSLFSTDKLMEFIGKIEKENNAT